MFKKRTYSIRIKSYKTLKIQGVQVVEIGDCKSQPFATLVCQLHGDEYSSLAIVQELIKLMTNKKNLLSVRIIATANPYGASKRIKFEPLTNRNLNRCFKPPFEPISDASNEIASKIAKLVKGSTFCIDLHDMPGSTIPISLILTKTNNSKVLEQNKYLINQFGAEVAWIEDFSDPQMAERYQGTLNSYLNSLNIPNFTIETSPVETITSQEILLVAQKLLSLLNRKQRTRNKIKYFVRNEIYAPVSGVIQPTKRKLLSRIKANETLGNIVTSDLREIQIKAPKSGVLIRKINPCFVSKGQKIFDLGERS